MSSSRVVTRAANPPGPSCPPAQVYALTTFLRDNGAEGVAVADLDYVFSRDNPLYSKLEEKLYGAPM